MPKLVARYPHRLSSRISDLARAHLLFRAKLRNTAAATEAATISREARDVIENLAEFYSLTPPPMANARRATDVKRAGREMPKRRKVATKKKK